MNQSDGLGLVGLVGLVRLVEPYPTYPTYPTYARVRQSIAVAVKIVKRLWALPITLVGLTIAALAVFGGRMRVVNGVVEAHGPSLRWLLSHCLPLSHVSAMTLGHVIIGRDAHCLAHSRAHEHVHVRQYERWGLLFIPAYALASVHAAATGGHYYRDNAFEREAYASHPHQRRG